MNKSLSAKLAAAALVFIACACAPRALAQTPDAKGAEAVRERRVTAAESAGAKTAGENAGAASDSTADAAGRARGRQEAALRLAESGDRAEAVALLRAMLAEDRFDPQFFYNTGNALARLDESEAAVQAYQKAVAQRRGNYSRAQHNLGVVLTRLGRWNEAEEALKAALKLESFNYAEASYSLGRLLALRGETVLAAAEWARTLRLNPEHADAAVSLARLLVEGGDAAQALAVLDALSERLARRGKELPREIAVARGEAVAAANLSAEEGRAGRTEVVKASSRAETINDADASSVLRNARASSQRPVTAGREAFDLLRRARAAREGGREEDAAALYRRAVESNGGYFAPANLELGYTLASMRRNEEAAANVLAVIRREGTRFPVAFYHVGRFYEHLNRLPEAEAAFERAAELIGDMSPQFYADLSRVREREGNYAGALAAAEEYVRCTSRAGAAPEWARARVEQLKKKVAQPAPANN